MVVKGFYPETITRGKKLLFLCIPNGKGKHAVEFFERFLPPYSVSGKKHLRICFSDKVIFSLKLTAQFAIIIYLSIKHNSVALIGAPERLSAILREINDGEPPMSKRTTFFLIVVETNIIRTAMCHGITRLRKCFLVRNCTNDTDNAAHDTPGYFNSLKINSAIRCPDLPSS